MTKQQLTEALAASLDGDREAFVEDVRQAVKEYIEAQGASCLDLVERRPGRDVVHRFSLSPGYLAKLAAFCTARPPRWDGHELDSALTTPVGEIVSRRFAVLYESSIDDFTAVVGNYIRDDAFISRSIVEHVIEASYADELAEGVLEQAVELIVERLSDTIASASQTTVVVKVSAVVSSAVAAPIAAKIAAVITKVVAMHAKVIVAKVLSMNLLKVATAAAMKKFIIVGLVASIAQAMAVKFGISASAGATVVLVPLLGAYVAYTVKRFPRHLGAKVSKRLASDLSESYTSMNEQVLAAVAEKVLGELVEKVAEDAVRSPELRSLVNSLLARI